MQIRLQSGAGPFNSDFIDSLGETEAAMIAIGLDPGKFVVSKNFAPSDPNDEFDFEPPLCEYTVYAGNEHFTLTQTDDVSFLAFFRALCLSARPHEAAPDLTPADVMTKFANR